MSVLDDLWKDAVGGVDWLKQVIFGEFDDHQSTSAIVAGMLTSFVPGAVIVMSARDMTAVIIRMVRHPEKREEVTEWMILVACAIGLVPALVAAAAGAAAAGVGAIVGGLAGDEAGAALRATCLLLIEDTGRMLEKLVTFLRRFVKGDILRFLREAKFVKYAEPVTQKTTEFLGHMASITRKVITKANEFKWIGRVGDIVKKLEALEKEFYALQGVAGKKIAEAMKLLDTRKDAALAEHAVQADHVVHPNKPAPKPPTPAKPTPKRVVARADTPLGKPEGLEPPDPMPKKTPPDDNLHPQGVEDQPSASKRSPASTDLKGISVTNSKGVQVQPVRVLQGDNGKVAIIGRSMDDAVNPYASELKAQGYDVETFTGDQIPKSANDQWADLKAANAPNYIPDDQVRSSELFQANTAWADKLKSQGYTVVDVGNPMGSGSSPFFDMEQQHIFGAIR